MILLKVWRSTWNSMARVARQHDPGPADRMVRREAGPLIGRAADPRAAANDTRAHHAALPSRSGRRPERPAAGDAADAIGSRGTAARNRLDVGRCVGRKTECGPFASPGGDSGVSARPARKAQRTEHQRSAEPLAIDRGYLDAGGADGDRRHFHPAAGGRLYFARPILLPVVAAVLIGMTLAPIVKARRAPSASRRG